MALRPASLVLLLAAGCDVGPPVARPALPATPAPVRSTPPPAKDPPLGAPPDRAAPAGEPGDRLHEESVVCRGSTLHGVVPRSWVREATPAECGARWSLPAPDGERAWVIVHCLPPGRVGLEQLDSWYRLFRRPDGSPLVEPGRGEASIGSVCALRDVGISASGTLVEPIACAPITPPAADLALRRSALEAPAAMFVFDLVGRPATLEAELAGVSGGVRWFSSNAADIAALVSSMRATSDPLVTSPYRRPCP